MRPYKIKVELKKHPDGSLSTLSVWDERTQKYWESIQISERGVWCFLDKEDCRQTLNWNLNGDSSQYHYKEKGDKYFALIYPNSLNISACKEYIQTKIGWDYVHPVINALVARIPDPIDLLCAIAECFPTITKNELFIFLD